MSRADAPAWLAELQARFSTALCTPLERASGTLRATCESYDASLCCELVAGDHGGERERLAIYNRQYWFRLFTAMHGDYRLTSRLLGYWDFNDYAGRFLEAHPPRSYDLHEVSEGFDGFLVGALASDQVIVERGAHTVARAAVLEAAHIDSAHRSVFHAPAEPRLTLSQRDAEHLPSARLVPSRSVAIMEEHWPLLELRRTLHDTDGGQRLSLPPPHPSPRSWLLFRTEHGTQVAALPRNKARLLLLLRAHTVSEALSRLEQEVSAEDRARLPALIQHWLAESMELGFWTALETSATAMPAGQRREG